MRTTSPLISLVLGLGMAAGVAAADGDTSLLVVGERDRFIDFCLEEIYRMSNW